jgi:hypothetical protein
VKLEASALGESNLYGFDDGKTDREWQARVGT